MEETKVKLSPILRLCTSCQAKPGFPCTQPTSAGRINVRWFHLDREHG